MTSYGIRNSHKEGWQQTWQEMLQQVDGHRETRAQLALDVVAMKVIRCRELKEVREKVKAKEDEIAMSEQNDVAAVCVAYLE